MFNLFEAILLKSRFDPSHGFAHEEIYVAVIHDSSKGVNRY
jgi:hypothetical protein